LTLRAAHVDKTHTGVSLHFLFLQAAESNKAALGGAAWDADVLQCKERWEAWQMARV
jgi:hypothetical protein